MLSGRGLCDELITRPEESYRLCCVVVCDLETSRMGAAYINDISHLRVNTVLSVEVDYPRQTLNTALNTELCNEMVTLLAFSWDLIPNMLIALQSYFHLQE